MFIRYAAIAVAIVFYCFDSFGQRDTIQLSEVEVIDTRISSEELYEYFDELTSPLIDARVNLKSNGPENLTTLNYRGGSASHLSVRWNGISIQSPMLGQLDASLIPFDLFDNARVLSSASDKGNTGLSGDLNLHLDSMDQKKEGFSLKLGTKSFNHRFIQTNLNLKEGSYSASLKAFYRYGKNNFQIPSEDQELYQKHAQFRSVGLLWTQQFKLKENQIIESHFWAQDRNSALAPNILQTRSQSHQFDQFYRGQLKYTHGLSKGKLALQLAYANDDNHFVDSLNLIDALNHFEQYDARVLFEKEIGKSWFFKTVLSYSENNSNSESYSERILRKQIEQNFRLEKNSKKWNAAVMWSGLKEIDFHQSFSFDYQYNILKRLKVGFRAGQNFRLPSLNDLYWRPGGNTNLETEKAKNVEMSILSSIDIGKFSLKPELSVYYRKTNNWVLWAFNTQSSFWSAENINEVQTKGIDLHIPSVVSFSNRLKNRSVLSASFIASEFQNSLNLPNIEKGDQIYYTPRFALGLVNQFTLKSFAFECMYEYKSATKGTLYTIDEYSLFHVSIKKEQLLNDKSLALEFALRNAFNKRYEMVERRPLPGRHFTISLKFDLIGK